MTRHFCGMWEYKTLIMDYIHTESFLVNLITKRRSLYIVVCDKNENAIVGIRRDTSDVYKVNGRMCVSGLILYDKHYRVKVDSLKNVSIVSVH